MPESGTRAQDIGGVSGSLAVRVSTTPQSLNLSGLLSSGGARWPCPPITASCLGGLAACRSWHDQERGFRVHMQKYQYTTTIGGRDITIETGTLAKLAAGAVTVRSGDSVLLATVTSAKPREGVDFFPLSVDYEERLYAAGRIPGSFQRREGRPSDQAILTSRLIDRPLRPLFPKGLLNEVQVIVTALARDPELHLDILGIIGASAAVTISDIPWEGPIGAVRVGFIDGAVRHQPDRRRRWTPARSTCAWPAPPTPS